MRDEQRKTQTELQEEDEAALERERLGGPADYDESGGTGLSAGDARPPSSGAAAPEPEPGGGKDAASEGADSDDGRAGTTE